MAAKAKKIPTFVWVGTDKRGAKVKGEAQANNVTLMKAELRRQGIAPKTVRKKSASLFGQRKKKITAGDIAVFSRQLATMMSAGVPMVQGLDIVGRGHDNPAMQDLVLKIKADVEGGTNLSQALAAHPRHFNELFCNLVEAGEAAGVLDTLLDKLATYLEKTESIKKKIKKALFYPAAVVVVAFLVTAILLIFVVPQFESLFRGFGADLPVFTRFVVNLSEFFQSYWYIIFGVLIGLGVAFVEGRKRSRKFVRLVDRLALKIPVIGTILEKAAIARYARTLSTMFAAGVPLVDALESVSGATGNVVYQEGVLVMRDQVASGQQLQSAMKLSNLFPNMVVQMTAIGEESGSLDTMLAKVADFYEEEVDNLIDSLSSLLEPMIMVVLGVLVGGLVIAMYLPIFQMGQVI
ncbi:type II secretion system F family protein [Methylonatrum kenyense]|uniref:type II secretion system F family protein n=1 Tax=Methylonatrum kenyense TaxID=455253 RepID=UPI0020BF168D|nr:type II secretion system F family protein [Methylonatrum kenyense]MCK8516307.1 type II secretion system F family protein [Methylonatrum kenyense]